MFCCCGVRGNFLVKWSEARANKYLNIIVSGNTFTLLYKVTSMSNRMWQLHQCCYYFVIIVWHTLFSLMYGQCAHFLPNLSYTGPSAVQEGREIAGCWEIWRGHILPQKSIRSIQSSHSVTWQNKANIFVITFTYRLKPKLGYDLHENGFMDSDFFHS